MDLITPSRRGFLIGLGTGIALLAAPPIVRASSIMPVKVLPPRIIKRKWYHVAVTRSGDDLVVFVDGVRVDVAQKVDDQGWPHPEPGHRWRYVALPHGMRLPYPPREVGSHQSMMMMGVDD